MSVLNNSLVENLRLSIAMGMLDFDPTHGPLPYQGTDPDGEPTCIFVDCFDDMYPEFAPDPLMVVCGDPAEFTVTVDSEICDDDGWPYPGHPHETLRNRYCRKHTDWVVTSFHSPYGDDSGDDLMRVDVTH